MSMQMRIYKSEKIIHSGGWRREELCKHADLDELRANLRISISHYTFLKLAIIILCYYVNYETNENEEGRQRTSAIVPTSAPCSLLKCSWVLCACATCTCLVFNLHMFRDY